MTPAQLAQQRIITCAPQDGKAWWWFGGLAIIKLAAAQTEGRISLIEMLRPPHLEIPLHVHTREDEMFHILEGSISYRIGGSQFEACAGHTVLAPKNIPHTLVVTSPQPAHYLVIYTPAGFEGFIRDTSRPAERLDLLPEPHTPPDPAAIQKISALMTSKYGCHFVT